MKGRPKNIRIISSMPPVSGFKPYGQNIRPDRKEPVILHYEEYEAIRLNDYDKYSQDGAASIMGISRPTFTRIYMCAREKIALAFIEARQIIIEGGKVKLDEQWRVCKRCKAIFSLLPDETETPRCPLCKNTDLDCCPSQRIAVRHDPRKRYLPNQTIINSKQ